MSTTVARLEAKLSADTRDFDRGMDSSERRMGAVGKAAKVGLGVVAVGAFGAATAAVGLLKVGMDELNQSQLVGAQTDAVLKSTGASANVTKTEIEGLAGAIMRKSGIDDEAVQSGENMLLTFTNIRNEVGAGNDIFNQSTSILADMSVALGTDMSKQAIQLGKALNDPVKGISALSRVGVTFTADQKELIKGMVASGDTMGAQKVILAELTKEFGGSAEAAGKTMPGQLNILKESFNNVAGDLAAKFLPLLTGFVDWVNRHWAEISATIDAVFTAVSFAVNNILKPAITAATTAVKAIVDWVRENWPTISRVTTEVFNDVRDVVQTVTAIVRGIWDRFGDEILAQTRTFWGAVRGTFENVLTVIRGIFNTFHGLFTGDWREMWDGVKDIFGGVAAQIVLIFKTLGETLRNLFSATVDALGELAQKAVGMIVAAFAALGGLIWQGINSGWDAMVDNIRDAFRAVYVWIKNHVVDAIVDAFADIPDRVADSLKSLPGKASGAVGSLAGKLNPFGDAADPRMVAPFTGSLMGALPVMGPFAAAAARYGLTVTSGLRPGALTKHGTLSDHAVGKALDVSGSPGGMAGFFQSLIGNSLVKQAFYDPLGSIFGGALNAYREGGHSDHVHVATYDRGGHLLPGWTLAYNGTGRPEPVGAGAGTVVNNYFPNYVGDKRELLDWLRGALLREQQIGRSILG